MDTCSFELENICGMIQSSDDNSDWQHLSHVPAGPSTDHTNMGECEGMGKHSPYLFRKYFLQRQVNWLCSWPCSMFICWRTTVNFWTKEYKTACLGKPSDTFCFLLIWEDWMFLSLLIFSSLNDTSSQENYAKCSKLRIRNTRHVRDSADFLNNCTVIL